MLVLRRSTGQGLEIGPIPGVGMVRVYVVRIEGESAHVGIEAPREIGIRRCELKPLELKNPDARRALDRLFNAD